MFSLSFASGNFFISFLIFSVTCWLFRIALFNLHVFVFLTVYFLSVDIQSHSVVVGEDVCYDFSFLEFTEIIFLTQDVFYPGEYSTCTWESVFFCIGWNVLKISMRSISSNVSFKTSISLLIFCFDDLSIGMSGVLKSPTIIVLLSISPFMS